MNCSKLIVLIAVFLFAAGALAINVTYTINTETGRATISPYIYGSNFDHVTCDNLTVRRMGGNRTTGYNWENNYSNAGSDYNHYNDRYMSQYLPPNLETVPGRVYYDFHNENLAAGKDSILTLQMAGYVAADDDLTVTVAQTAPSTRWKEVVFRKSAPFCNPAGSPLTTDGYVYMDEFINYLVTTFGNASTLNGVRFYSMDNEPALWSSTHVRIHPNKVGCAELVNRTTTLASAVKDVDPYALITGPALYGFGAYHDLQSAPDWAAVQGSYNWFIDYFLAQMNAAAASEGRRLLDVLDVHWYPEAQDDNGTRITTLEPTNTNYTARMQAPRTLWDTGYMEKSWIAQPWFSDHLPIINKLTASIDTYYPGTKLGITEYNYGGKDHISGGIAQADVLGIFGKYGVYMSTYWGGNGPYTNAAFRLYRDYDGADSTFGNTKVTASMSDKVNSSIYASMFAGVNNELHLIVLNKHLTDSIIGTFNVTSPCPYTSGRVWRFNSVSATITETTAISSIAGNSFAYTVPALTACHIVLESGRPLGDLYGDCMVNLRDLAAFSRQWLEAGDCTASNCADFDGDDFVGIEDLLQLSEDWLL